MLLRISALRPTANVPRIGATFLRQVWPLIVTWIWGRLPDRRSPTKRDAARRPRAARCDSTLRLAQIPPVSYPRILYADEMFDFEYA